jgi:hypothetical protein
MRLFVFGSSFATPVWALSAALSLLSLGCGGQKPFPWRAVERGDVLTPGVTIAAADGSFQYRSGEPFVPTETASNCPIVPTTRNWTEVSGRLTRVSVRHPRVSAPLYGLLAFCPIPATQQPSSQSHGVQIPDYRVEQTDGGRVAVVYDDVQYHWRYYDGHGISAVESWPSWILWISQQPL